MARELTPDQISALSQAQKDITRLTRMQVFTLAKTDLIEIKDGQFLITQKAVRALARHGRSSTLSKSVMTISDAALGLLSSQESKVSHRQIWNAAGGETKFSRSEVSDALRALRDEGILSNDKSSSNNFQITWMRGPSAPQLDLESDPPEETPVAHVSREIAEAFGMMDLPNVVVID
jgi:hypothetical protein